MGNDIIKFLTGSKDYLINNQNYVYYFNKANYFKLVYGLNTFVSSILKSYFTRLDSLNSEPIFFHTPNKIRILVFYYRGNLDKRISKESKNNFKYYLHRLNKNSKSFNDLSNLNLTADQINSLLDTAKYLELSKSN